MKSKKMKEFSVTVAIATIMFLALTAPSFAQGFDLSQLLGGAGGGGSSPHHQGSSNQSNGDVTVQRGAAPITGTFTGKQAGDSGTQNINSQFACYPAHDPVFAQTETFICYAANGAAESGGNGQSSDDQSNANR